MDHRSPKRAGAGAGRQSRGRQRIPIRRIERQDDLYATFSKRRLGIYKKASELCTLCGVDIGLIIFSPTNNPYSFFHPSMNSILDRQRSPNLQMGRMMDSLTRANIKELNRSLDEVLEQKEKEKQLEESGKNREKGWWEVPVETLNKDQVEEWMDWLQDLHSRTASRIQELKNDDDDDDAGSGSSSSLVTPPTAPPASSAAAYHQHTNSNPNLMFASNNYSHIDPNYSFGSNTIGTSSTGGGRGGYSQLLNYPNDQQNYRHQHHGFQYGQGQVMERFGAGPSSSHHHHQQHQGHGGVHDMFGPGGSGDSVFGFGASFMFPDPPQPQGINPFRIGGSGGG